jgi:hypothetical protein
MPSARPAQPRGRLAHLGCGWGDASTLECSFRSAKYRSTDRLTSELLMFRINKDYFS